MFTRTTTQLLESLQDPANVDVWQILDERYRPVVHAFARRRGLNDDDAAEVAQSTLAQFATEYRAGRYDRGRGRLSSWIIGIASNRIADVGRSRRRRAGERGDSAFVHLAEDSVPDESDWQYSLQKVILERALQSLRTSSRTDARTIAAFELCALRGVPPETAAAECGMTVAEVYVAKHRITERIRSIVAQLTMEYEGS